jgi:tRNA nucleotidyltransferase (CCA-adding enzyme)
MSTNHPIRFFLVGGTIRDELLGHKPSDIDYCVEAHNFETMRDYLLNNKYEIYVEKPEYGTLKAKCPLTKVVSDYSLCRKDSVYSDFRRPDSIEIANIYEDLSRRDFKMNAIAKLQCNDGTYEYYDPYDGARDIENKEINCVGNTIDRLTEDPLRGLRALRFSVTKGFTISDEIISVIHSTQFIDNFCHLAKERIQIELQKMFQFNTVKSIEVLNTLPQRLLQIIFTESNIWLLPTLKKNKKNTK